MKINIVNNADGFSEEKLTSLEGYIAKLSEVISGDDYCSPQVARSLKDAYATLTYVTPDEIREINRQ